MASTDKTTGSALGKRSFAQCDDRDSDAALQTAQIPSALAQRSDGRHPEGSDIAGAKYQHLNGGGNAAHRSAADGGRTSIAQGQRSRNVVLNVAPQALAALKYKDHLEAVEEAVNAAKSAAKADRETHAIVIADLKQKLSTSKKELKESREEGQSLREELGKTQGHVSWLKKDIHELKAELETGERTKQAAEAVTKELNYMTEVNYGKAGKLMDELRKALD